MNKRRYVHETHIMKNALVPVIYHPCLINTNDRDRANWHENIEILCFYSGVGEIHLETECMSVKSGDIVIVNPDVLHHISSESSVEYHCLIIDRKFCEENGIDILSLEFREIVTDEALYRQYVDLIEKIKNVGEAAPDGLSVAEARYALLGLLISICKGYLAPSSEHKHPKPSSSERVKTVMLYLQARVSEPITLDEISEHVGVSKYHLSREFKLYAGTTLFDYLNIIRCKQAQRMLANGATVSEAASSCGFESLSYFSRSFKKYTGKLPSSYTKKYK